MSGQYFYSTFLSFFVGVYIFSYVHLSMVLSIVMVGFILVALMVCVQRSLLGGNAFVFMGGIAFLVGGMYVGFSRSHEQMYDVVLKQKREFQGTICSDPDIKESTIRFCFKADHIKDKVLVVSTRYPEYVYGERIKVIGVLTIPENFETYPGGPLFDYKSYLLKDGIRYTMFRPDIEKLGGWKGNQLIGILIHIKKKFTKRIERLFLEPESSLLGGILLGDKQGLSKEVTDDFKKAGLVHILVLSGYNITIVAESLIKMFSFLPRLIGNLFGASSIVLFALMTGASATTVRASIMALIVILAKSTSRKYNISRALVLAAFCMVLENPLILAFDVSFQLSFLATLGLVYISPLVLEEIQFVTERFNMREIVATSIGVQIAVAPYIVYSMGTFSIVSIISNLFVLPLIPFIMGMGFVSTMLSFLFEWAALPFSWITSLCLSYVLILARFFAELPFSSVYIRAGAFAPALIYTLTVLVLIFIWRRKNSLEHSPN